MAFLTINDEHDVAFGEITVPETGRAVARLKLATPGLVLEVGVAITARFQNGLEYRMTVARSNADGGFSSLVAVGGADRAHIAPKAKFYEGIALRSIASDAIREAGETVGSIALEGIAQRWTRREQSLVETLEQLCAGRGVTWWVDRAGAVNIDRLEWPTDSSTELTVVGDLAAYGALICEINPEIEPRRVYTINRAGRRYQAQVLRVVHRIGSKLRTEVVVEGVA
jgi:hypothetical protein